MNKSEKIDKLHSFIYEAPIAYDDETEKKLGQRDKATDTVWAAAPDKYADETQIARWVSRMVNQGVLGQVLGQGITRVAMFNDGKTVFKWNHDTKVEGNQTETEIAIYEKLQEKWREFVPKILKHGVHWSIQERADLFIENNIVDQKKVKSLFPFLMRSSIDLQKVILKFPTLMKAFNQKYIDYPDFFDLPYPQRVEEAGMIPGIHHGEDDSDFYDKQLDALVSNKKIRGLIDFAYHNNLIWDLKFHNMGTIGDRVVMVDYGLLGMGRTK